MSNKLAGVHSFYIMFAPLHFYTSAEISEELLLKFEFNLLLNYCAHTIFTMNLTEIIVLPLESYKS